MTETRKSSMDYFFNHTDRFKKEREKDPKFSKSYRRHAKISPIIDKSKKGEAISKTLDKARGGMIGNLKRTMRDKDLKKDHYQEFKKQHNIK